MTDLHKFAAAMARAASIVLDGDLDWRVANDTNARSPHVMACAGQWLLENAKLDSKRLIVAGPLGTWGGGETPKCMPGQIPCFNPIVHLNFGDSTGVDSSNTDLMLTADGQFGLAKFAAKSVKLGAVRPEWFTVHSRK